MKKILVIGAAILLLVSTGAIIVGTIYLGSGDRIIWGDGSDGSVSLVVVDDTLRQQIRVGGTWTSVSFGAGGGVDVESDPVYSADPASGISGTNITNWSSAYGWGNHASEGYLTGYTETDPVYSGDPAFGITGTNINNWTTAYNWGNHAGAGYLTEVTETDPVYSGDPASGITATNITNWGSAFGWGNHASEGYLTSFTELDPVFTSSVAATISQDDLNFFQEAYSWGNHADQGYLTNLGPISSFAPDFWQIGADLFQVTSQGSGAALALSATGIESRVSAYNIGGVTGTLFDFASGGEEPLLLRQSGGAVTTGTWEFEAINIGPDATDDSWRIVLSDANDDLLLQRYEGGTWTTVQTWTP